MDEFELEFQIPDDRIADQDAAAGRAHLEQRAAQDPGAWIGAGWLAAREERLAVDCEHACRKARPFRGGAPRCGASEACHDRVTPEP